MKPTVYKLFLFMPDVADSFNN